MKKSVSLLVIFSLIVSISAVLVAFILPRFSIASLARTKATRYARVDDGNGISRYSGGRLRRIAGLPPQIEVSGTHYEMGLQYGILLKEEIIALIREGHMEVFRALAMDEGIPEWLLAALLKFKTDSVYAALPDRFKDELRGVSEGTGLSLGAIKICALFADVMKFEDASQNCSSLLMRAGSGGIIHASNMDDRFGKLQVKYRVVRKFRPTGYPSYIDAHNALYFGVHTGVNEYGLAASGQSVGSRCGNAEGIGEDYLLRIVLEGAKRVGDVAGVLDAALPMYGTADMVSDGKGNGALFDVASGKESAIRETPLTGNFLWGINEYKDEAFEGEYGHELKNECESNKVRAQLFTDYFERNEGLYAVRNTVEVMRLNGSAGGPETKDSQYLEGVCTVATQKTVLYAEDRKGLFLSTGNGYYAAYSRFYFWDFDFDREPSPADRIGAPFDLPVDWAELGELIQGTRTARDRAAGLREFAEPYPSPFASFLAARSARESKDIDAWREYAGKAYQAKAGPRYAIEYAHALYKRGETAEAYSILRETDSRSIASMEYRATYHALMRMLAKSMGDSIREKESSVTLESLPLSDEEREDLLE